MKLYFAKNKHESRNLINKLKLNSCPEIFIKKESRSEAIEFISKYPAKFYVVRDATHSSAKYCYIKNIDEYDAKVELFPDNIILAVSLNSYEGKLCVGAINILDDVVYLCCSTNPSYDHRTMYHDLDYDLETNIFDKKLSSIPYYEMIEKYIYDHKLEGLFVEFTIYSDNVGNMNEKILISELRDY